MANYESFSGYKRPRGGTMPVRSAPRPDKIPGAEWSSGASAELQAALADIRLAEMAAAGPEVVGGRPPEPLSEDLKTELRRAAFDGTIRTAMDEATSHAPELGVD